MIDQLKFVITKLVWVIKMALNVSVRVPLINSKSLTVRGDLKCFAIVTLISAIAAKINVFEPAVSSVAKRTLLVQEVRGSIPGPVKSTQCRQRLATVATFLRSCVAQALSRVDGPRNSLHASA